MNDSQFLDRELRPIRALLTYFFLFSLLTGPALPIVFAVLFFRYRTLRYELDDEGISMRWGVLFRREIHLAYDRLQDIHLSSNAVERHLGLAKVKLQTASGSSRAEITIEGVEEFEALRDFLYSRMRGASESRADEGEASELTRVLEQVVSEIRGLREDLRRGTPSDGEIPPESAP